MNANELADEYQEWKDDFLSLREWGANAEAMLRQQQEQIEELEKENTDLRYLIATKLEQQDGISLNSMAHPITNTPEPSYEIDPDKLETIEIDLPSPKPIAWIDKNTGKPKMVGFIQTDYDIPLYTHPAKTLTDEEILQLWKEFDDNDADNWFIEIARAILRRAQEK